MTFELILPIIGEINGISPLCDKETAVPQISALNVYFIMVFGAAKSISMIFKCAV